MAGLTAIKLQVFSIGGLDGFIQNLLIFFFAILCQKTEKDVEALKKELPYHVRHDSS
jgi:hypothetical protein